MNSPADDAVDQQGAAGAASRAELFLGTVALLAFALGGWWLLKRLPETAPPLASGANRRPVAVRTIVAARSDDVRESREYVGVIKSRRTSDLGFERPGSVTEVLVEEGDSVTRGEVLAERDREPLAAQRTAIELALNSARGRLTELTGPQDLSPTERLAQLRDLGGEVRRLEQEALGRQNISNPSSNLGERLSNVERRVALLDPGNARREIQAANEQIARLEQDLREIDVELNAAFLKAPFDGTVAARFVDEGTVVGAGTPILRLLEAGAAEAWIGIPSGWAAQRKPGDEATLTAGGRQLAAKFKAILPQVEASARTRLAILEFADATAAAEAIPGSTVMLTLATDPPKSGIWLPITALTREIQELWSVFVCASDADGIETVERQYVDVLLVEADSVLVEGTLREGDRVIVDGVHRVVPGQRVERMDVADGDAASGTSALGTSALGLDEGSSQ